MKTGNIIDISNLGERDFDTKELFSAIRNNSKVWSWGAHAWKYSKSKWLRFKSEGHLHKGHVYITLAYDDTFTVYYTSAKGKILDIHTNVYIDVLIETIDNRIERIPAYVR